MRHLDYADLSDAHRRTAYDYLIDQNDRIAIAMWKIEVASIQPIVNTPRFVKRQLVAHWVHLALPKTILSDLQFPGAHRPSDKSSEPKFS